MTRLRVYVASKFRHAQMWKDLFADWEYGDIPIDVRLNARWVTDYAELIPDEPQFCKIGWKHDIEDIKTSDLLLLFAEKDEHLRGALVEAGAAIAFGKPVILIGSHSDYGTWQFHELVYRVDDFASAKTLLKCFLFGAC